jgi:glutamine cyclotransferase
MRVIITMVMAAAMLVVACGAQGGGKSKMEKGDASKIESVKESVAVQYDYRIVGEYPHSTNSYTQGLQYVDGVMWEGTGQEGDSHLQRIDLKTGKRTILASLPANEFGEGITHYKERIYQLTWLSNKAYVYNKEGKTLKTISYEGEGWCITTDGERLFMSDGTPVIRVVDADSFETLETIPVTIDGRSLNYINELEWVDGSIWANVYISEVVVEIDPSTGRVKGYVDLSPLRRLLVDNPEAEALNGIAYNSATGNFYVTGKDWKSIFEIEIYK